MWTPHPLLVGAVGLQGRHAGDPSFFLAWSEGGLLRVTGRITAPGDVSVPAIVSHGDGDSAGVIQ